MIDEATRKHLIAWLDSHCYPDDRDEAYEGITSFLHDADDADYWTALGWRRVADEARDLNYISRPI